jgi:hypothetical protein
MFFIIQNAKCFYSLIENIFAVLRQMFNGEILSSRTRFKAARANGTSCAFARTRKGVALFSESSAHHCD